MIKLLESRIILALQTEVEICVSMAVEFGDRYKLDWLEFSLDRYFDEFVMI